MDIKVRNLLLDAIWNIKACGTSLQMAATEHKDTILDEDKQRLGNFVSCLQNGRCDIVTVCFGSMAKQAHMELDMYACHLNYIISMDTQNGLHACTRLLLFLLSLRSDSCLIVASSCCRAAFLSLS